MLIVFPYLSRLQIRVPQVSLISSLPYLIADIIIAFRVHECFRVLYLFCPPPKCQASCDQCEVVFPRLPSVSQSTVRLQLSHDIKQHVRFGIQNFLVVDLHHHTVVEPEPVFNLLAVTDVVSTVDLALVHNNRG